jgi:quaternary ammonium compound-resistance protein SugE
MASSAAWIYLLIAGFFEITWAVSLKYSQGFSRFWPALLSISAMILSIIFLSKALKILPLGTAYAVWTGIGAAGTAIIGIFLFQEPKDVLRLLCIGLILTGIVGLRIFSTT